MKMHATWRAMWPRSLAGRLLVLLLSGVVIAHALSVALLLFERHQSSQSMILDVVERDVATSIAVLNRLPASERAAWLPTLDRRNYHFILDEAPDPSYRVAVSPGEVTAAVMHALKNVQTVRIVADPKDERHMQAYFLLSGGQKATIDIHPAGLPLANWLPLILGLQLAILVGCTLLAARLLVRPLKRLGDAANALDPTARSKRLDEGGPTEVAYAAAAFNTMQERISAHLDERTRILAAISHDLQTPLTRLKLRTEMMEESSDQEKMFSDLEQMEKLIQEGVTYAKTLHGIKEEEKRLDLAAFLESLVSDYQDMGKEVALTDSVSSSVMSRPAALRRILTNLIDNALKFAGGAEIRLIVEAGRVRIGVLDRGPGIPDAEMQAVRQPFYRLENSRNRDTGGTGLGLAIADQLATSIGGTMLICARDGGGLCVEILLPCDAAKT
jgi:signal transduction histidine kinase